MRHWGTTPFTGEVVKYGARMGTPRPSPTMPDAALHEGRHRYKIPKIEHAKRFFFVLSTLEKLCKLFAEARNPFLWAFSCPTPTDRSLNQGFESSGKEISMRLHYCCRSVRGGGILLCYHGRGVHRTLHIPLKPLPISRQVCVCVCFTIRNIYLLKVFLEQFHGI